MECHIFLDKKTEGLYAYLKCFSNDLDSRYHDFIKAGIFFLLEAVLQVYRYTVLQIYKLTSGLLRNAVFYVGVCCLKFGKTIFL